MWHCFWGEGGGGVSLLGKKDGTGKDRGKGWKGRTLTRSRMREVGIDMVEVRGSLDGLTP